MTLSENLCLEVTRVPQVHMYTMLAQASHDHKYVTYLGSVRWEIRISSSLCTPWKEISYVIDSFFKTRNQLFLLKLFFQSCWFYCISFWLFHFDNSFIFNIISLENNANENNLGSLQTYFLFRNKCYYKNYKYIK